MSKHVFWNHFNVFTSVLKKVGMFSLLQVVHLTKSSISISQSRSLQPWKRSNASEFVPSPPLHIIDNLCKPFISTAVPRALVVVTKTML